MLFRCEYSFGMVVSCVGILDFIIPIVWTTSTIIKICLAGTSECTEEINFARMCFSGWATGARDRNVLPVLSTTVSESLSSDDRFLVLSPHYSEMLSLSFYLSGVVWQVISYDL